MASQSGYHGSTTPVVSYFSKEQRARLEAFTFARELLLHQLGRAAHLSELLDVADYIVKGDR